MMFKNKKERTNWIFALFHVVILSNYLPKWDFQPRLWYQWVLVLAVVFLIGLHVYAAIKHRKKGTLPS